ncbi:uncharacterized protein LOC114515606 [Dendronephthya gigantea]|uniref:uncharacterized protein LOC114515606 n=1 Tax=Dendronephthya gigantea TaxID=151771 RepID=UPI00106C930C|nr:uncharacterized protein LOC114515606 [Dendronephthya gigantea]
MRCPRITRSKALTSLLLVVLLYLYNENSVLRVKIKTLEYSNMKRAALADPNKSKQVMNDKEEINASSTIINVAKAPQKIHQSLNDSSGLDRTSTESDRVAFASEKLSIIIYDEKGVLPSSRRVKQLQIMFPKSAFFWNDHTDNNLATSLNNIIKKVNTKYFLFLEPKVMPSDRAQEDVASLWNALEKYPGLDVIGGSYLAGNKLYVQCSRYRLCRWTFSESYEYVRFLDNIMICDGISSSFMARTSSIQNISLLFDPKMNDITALKDFFYRAKGYNLTTGTRPSMMFLQSQYKSLYQLWTSRAVAEELVSFAVKHKVLIFKDIEGKLIELCSPSSPLSGKGLCIERNSHELLLGGGHWAYKGLYAYPYLYQYLVTTLFEVTDHLERHNVSYLIDGGVSIGAIKMHSVLPWDSGDIDVQVFGLTVQQIYELFQPFKEQKGYVVRLISNPEQVHVFCTPKNVGDLSGGIATIFSRQGPIPELMKIKTNGRWINYSRALFRYLIDTYGEDKFLGHSLHGGRETMECKIKGHNACLPNFKNFLNGKGGTAREYFCEI